MAKRKAKIETKPGWVIEDFPNPPESDVKAYRRIRPPKQKNHLITVAVLKNGKTQVTSIWHPDTEKKASNPDVQKALNKAQRRKKNGDNKAAGRVSKVR